MAVNHIVIYSGGMDSFTLLNWVLRRRAYIYRDPTDEPEEHNLFALSFDYGQRHRRELDCVAKVCAYLAIPSKLINLASLRDIAKGSALTDDVPVPHGHYQSEQMKKTVVPGRNTVMLAMALAFAEGLSPDDQAFVYYGAHAGDHHIYPDCRPEYLKAMRAAIALGSDGRVQLEAPFIDMSKADILREGLTTLRLSPGAYADTWTCYAGEAKPCGKCGACVERLLAFDECRATDPLVYQDRTTYKASA